MLNTPVQNKIVSLKYAYKRPDGTKEKDWGDVTLRTVTALAQDSKYATAYYNLIFNLVFMPGGRILANAGTGIKSLMNCYSLGLQDSRQSIYSTLKEAAEVFAHGGGVGYNFSNIREEGAHIVSTGGQASGPLSFLTLFDQTGEVIQQASRRGAQLAVLNVDHPDIEKFIDFKSTLNYRNQRIVSEYLRNLEYMGVEEDTNSTKVIEKTLQDDQLTHFNVSVGITDEFMNCVITGEDFELKSVVDGKVVRKVNAKELLRKIALRAWESGDPGLLFLDTANANNMVPYVGKILNTNPCGEVTLLPYESCCLGSLNLSKFVEQPEDEGGYKVNWEFLEYATRQGIRFLDDVQRVSEAPLEPINAMSKGLRRLGLGVCGFADLLAEMEIPYNSETALDLANYISWFISFMAWQESFDMAEEKGAFEYYDASKVNREPLRRVFESQYVPYKFDYNRPVRNVAVTSLAPTGSIALVAGVNSGIEPFFALAYKRNITQGIGNTATDYVIELNPILFRKLKKYNVPEADIEKIKEYVMEKGTVQGCELVPEKLRKVFVTAHEITPSEHIEMQASWQEYVSNSVSKTINLPHDATVEDIEQAIVLMWYNNLVGGTVYRDASKMFQVLNVGAKK